MGTSWYEKVKEFKSPLRVVAAVLLRSRETQNAKVRELHQRIAELESQVAQQRHQLQEQQQRLESFQQRAVKAERERDRARQSVHLPEDPPQGTHGYGPRMISLAVNLARSAGLRGAVRVLQVFFAWLGLMGSPDSDTDADAHEKPQHRVRITRPFYLGVYPVTQSQYGALMGTKPSSFKGGGNCPVETVPWEEANAFCRKFAEVLRNQTGGLVCRLPTEAEWEYACRAGTTTRYYFGDDAAQLGEYAWFSGNSVRTTHPVGQKKPNAWGLYDMHGNVWEWCQDGYDPAYYGGCPIEDPAGVPQASNRVRRGGSWRHDARSCRSAYRYRYGPALRRSDLGFRVALVPSGT